MPFAEAHELAGEAVRYCEERGIDLPDLTAEQLAEISPLLTAEVLTVLTVQGSIESRDGRGGTATVQVERQLREMWDEIDEISDWCLESLAAHDSVPQPEEEPQLEWRADRPPVLARLTLTGQGCPQVWLTRSNEPFGSRTSERVPCQGSVVAPCRREGIAMERPRVVMSVDASVDGEGSAHQTADPDAAAERSAVG